MPVVVAGDSYAMAEHIRWRKPKNLPLPADATSTDREAYPTSLGSKTTVSSILLPSSPTNDNASKKKSFTSATFRGLGCTASSQVSVPAVIRTSANWEAKKMKKKRFKANKLNRNSNPPINCNSATSSAVAARVNPLSQSSLSLALSLPLPLPDGWCGPGNGLTTDAASVDYVVSRRTTRSKVDGIDRMLLGHRKCSEYSARRMVIPEDIQFLEADAGIGMPRFHADISEPRHHRYARRGFCEGFAEVVMLQSNLLMGGRLDGLDRYRDMRLDVDNMTYEELLELGDKIGYVNTGLREDDIASCLKMSKHAMMNDLSSHFTIMERKCSICQEEYEPGDELGTLNCSHFYHIDCIKHWLGQKNICPICKKAAVSKS